MESHFPHYYLHSTRQKHLQLSHFTFFSFSFKRSIESVKMLRLNFKTTDSGWMQHLKDVIAVCLVKLTLDLMQIFIKYKRNSKSDVVQINTCLTYN